MAKVQSVRSKAAKRTASPSLVHQFLIVLSGTDPLVWRRIRVPQKYSFWDLHVAIQDAMGWLDYHLHEFRLLDADEQEVVSIGIPDDDEPEDRPVLPGWEVPLSKFFERRAWHAPPAVYAYDFGDDWEHVVVHEGMESAEAGLSYPRCVSGARRCPPEDCGGVHGFAEFLKAIADPKASRAHVDAPVVWRGLRRRGLHARSGDVRRPEEALEEGVRGIGSRMAPRPCHSVFQNLEYGMPQGLLSQDVMVLAKLVAYGGERPSMAQVASDLSLSASQVHASLKRLERSRLLDAQTGRPLLKAVEEFLVHAVKYAFPAQRGEPTRGLPTAHAAAPLRHQIVSAGELPPVWPDPDGEVRGGSFEPLHRAVPHAARKDPRLYELLALVDALRDGRVRERKLAEKALSALLRSLLRG